MSNNKIKADKNYFSLAIWILALIAIGSIIGSLTKPEISTWYSTLNCSPLTPPNYIFPIAWTILYGIIGACGWLIYLIYPKIRTVLLLMLPYLSWILFASYLNFYIWWCN